MDTLDTKHQARSMISLTLPALLIGAGCSLVLLATMGVAEALQTYLWQTLPNSLGVAPSNKLWLLAMLTASGVAVGLLVRYAPGHAGPHPATTSLMSAPLPLRTLPGLAAALIVGLAGGVSLGPENPIMAITIALAAILGKRLHSGVSPTGWVMLASSGTLGAMFGTPVAAALILSEPVMRAAPGEALWDRLFAPLVAAAAGALTTSLFVHPIFSVDVPSYQAGELLDLLTGTAVALAALVLGLIAIRLFPLAYRLFAKLRHPVLILGCGGFTLGLLGMLGGEITLFKGLAEMKALASNAGSYGAQGLLLVCVVKLAALVVAATSGFRGGRIFPAVFVGVALGLFAHALVTQIPLSLAIACGVLGLTLCATQDGWLSIFMAAAVVPDLHLLPVLCIVILPAWLLLVAVGKPKMQIISAAPDTARPAPASTSG
jgi:H+/Cl- antiporter ClcA